MMPCAKRGPGSRARVRQGATCCGPGAAGDGVGHPGADLLGRGGLNASRQVAVQMGLPDRGTGPGAVACCVLAAADEIKALIGRNPRGWGFLRTHGGCCGNGSAGWSVSLSPAPRPSRWRAISMSSEELESHRAVLDIGSAPVRERGHRPFASWQRRPGTPRHSSA